MKKHLLAALAAAPLAFATGASAEHWDVIAFEMTGACTLGEYMEIVADTNEWAAQYGYQAKVAQPLQSDDLETWFWIGISADAAAFGAAYNAWRDGLADPRSTPAKLWDRFQKCSTNLSRDGYEVWQ
ncbi:MAG: hypothetical protein AAFW81_03875 [Pseudomonadota bacterium]